MTSNVGFPCTLLSIIAQKIDLNSPKTFVKTTTDVQQMQCFRVVSAGNEERYDEATQNKDIKTPICVDKSDKHSINTNINSSATKNDDEVAKECLSKRECLSDSKTPVNECDQVKQTDCRRKLFNEDDGGLQTNCDSGEQRHGSESKTYIGDDAHCASGNDANGNSERCATDRFECDLSDGFGRDGNDTSERFATDASGHCVSDTFKHDVNDPEERDWTETSAVKSEVFLNYFFFPKRLGFIFLQYTQVITKALLLWTRQPLSNT